MDWYVVQHQKQLGCRENSLKYTDFTHCRIILLFFSSPSHFVAVHFVALKTCTVNCTSVLPINCASVLPINCTSVLPILPFTSQYIFQRKRKEWVFW